MGDVNRTAGVGVSAGERRLAPSAGVHIARRIALHESSAYGAKLRTTHLVPLRGMVDGSASKAEGRLTQAQHGIASDCDRRIAPGWLDKAERDITALSKELWPLDIGPNPYMRIQKKGSLEFVGLHGLDRDIAMPA